MPTVAHPRRYRGDHYWEKEEPRTAKTDKARVVFYPQAGKLQVSGAWRDQETGKVRYGRTAVLDAAEVGSSPETLALLADFLKTAQSMLPVPRTTGN